MNIKMTSIVVTSPNDAIKFYTKVLGFEKLMHLPEMQLAIIVAKDQPKGTALMLEPNSNPISKRFQEDVYKANLPCIVFGSDDVWAEYDRLVDLGVNFTQKPIKSEWGTTAVFDDTFGNLIQIHQD